MIKTIATKPNEKPKHVEMTAQEIEQREKEDAEFLAEKPFNDWLQEITTLDEKMPRYLEDTIAAVGVEKYDRFIQTKYAEKQALRSKKPASY